MESHKIEKLNWAFLLISFIGLMDALYLSVERMRGVKIICVILEGCDQVTSSSYSTLFSIPVAYLGAAYYLAVFLMAFWFLLLKKEETVRMISWVTAVGFLASVWFVYLQIYVIKAICFYCMLSATTSTSLFILGIYYLVSYYKKGRQL